MATPGAGKTTYALTVAAELMVLASKDKDKKRASVTRQLIVAAMAAQDQVGRVAHLLNNSTHDEVRKAAVVTLRHWIGGHAGRDEKLYATDNPQNPHLYLINTTTGLETTIAALPFGFSSGLELMNPGG